MHFTCSTVATGDPQQHAKMQNCRVADPASASQQALVFGLASRGWALEWGYLCDYGDLNNLQDP